MGCGSKLTTKLLTQRTCPFLSAKSNNKLVIRGHLLPPDNTYSEQERSVGGQTGILAAVGSSSFVDCFPPHPAPARPSRGPAAGWEDARRRGAGCSRSRLSRAGRHPCTPTPWPGASSPRSRWCPLGADGVPSVLAWWDSGCTSRVGSRLAGRQAPGTGLCLSLPSAFPGDAVHTLVSCPQASSPEAKHSRRLCVS